MDKAARLRGEALRIGFDVAGIAPARVAPHADAFHRWLAAGRQAGMAWLAREPARRTDPAQVLPGARSILCVGLSCHSGEPPPDILDDPLRGRIARYAWGPDYHEVMKPMLDELSAFIAAEWGPSAQVRGYVDTGPVLERETAWQAGLGFIGRNTLLISPHYGSHLLLAELLLTLDLEPDAPAGGEGAELALADGRVASCGSCTRCQSACPTGAFAAPYVLDANRCLSYLTIENKGEIPAALRPLLGRWIFGCDACQTVCPWVRQKSRPGARRFLAFDADRFAPRLDDVLGWDEAAFRERYRGTPVLRAKRRGLLRNAAVALGNVGGSAQLPALERASADADPLVAEHARWAHAHIMARLAGGA